MAENAKTEIAAKDYFVNIAFPVPTRKLTLIQEMLAQEAAVAAAAAAKPSVKPTKQRVSATSVLQPCASANTESKQQLVFGRKGRSESFERE